MDNLLKFYINGEWVEPVSDETMPVLNPASAEQIGEVALGNEADIDRAVAAASSAFGQYGQSDKSERLDLLRRIREVSERRFEELAQAMRLEMGAPITMAREAQADAAIGHLDGFMAALEELEEQQRFDNGEVLLREPIGVCGLITPWNWPINQVVLKVLPVIATGCTCVLKPSEHTPISAMLYAEILHEAGVPAGVFNLVNGVGPVVGSALSRHPGVQMMSFTGSTPVGKHLLAQCASTVKKTAMELGGNAPFIVFDDADVDAAVNGAIASKFRNAGQTCVCTNRFLVQDGIYDAFVAKLTERVNALNVGDGLTEGSIIGPLINQAAVDKVQRHVDDAVNKGARLLCGGQPHAAGERFFTPTVLADVTTQMAVADEETFGPVAPVFRFQRDEEAIAMANDTPFGLAAYFYATDYRRIWRTMEALEYGMVGVNEGLISTELAPFGGVKESGLGREGSHHGLDEFTELKYVCVGGL